MPALLYRLTTLVRAFDFRLRSNRAIVGVASVAMIAGYAVVAPGGMEAGPSSAVALGGGALATWAITRELDPDEPASALVAALLAVGVILAIGASDLVIMFALIVTARFLLRSVGPPPTLLDMAAITALGVFLGTRPGGWPVALVLAFAVARDRTLPGVPARFGRVVALIIAAGSTGLAVAAGVGFWVRPTSLEWAVAIGGLVAGILIRPAQPMSPTDAGGMVLVGVRLASARRLTIAALTLAVVFSGATGIVAIGGGFAALFSVFVVQRRILPVGSGPNIVVGRHETRGAHDDE